VRRVLVAPGGDEILERAIRDLEPIDAERVQGHRHG